MHRPAFPQQQFQGAMPQIPLPQIDYNEYQSLPDIDSKKQFIGNNIYPIIDHLLGSTFSGKITGMLLDEKAVDIDKLLIDQPYLNSKVFEAHQLLL